MPVQIVCPTCKKEFTAVYHPSICTWLAIDLIQDIYDRGFVVQCEHCKIGIPLHYKVLINSPLGMFYLDLGQEQETIRKILTEWEIIDSEGKVLDWDAQGKLIKKRKRKEAVQSFKDF